MGEKKKKPIEVMTSFLQSQVLNVKSSKIYLMLVC